MYAKIENDLVVEYPLYEGDLQNRFPELNFPLDACGEDIPNGYVKVETLIPPLNPDFVYEEITPIKQGDVFVQHWSARSSTEEERDQLLEQQKINNTLQKLNELLSSAVSFRESNADTISQEDLMAVVKYIRELNQLRLSPIPEDGLSLPEVPSVLLK